VMIKQGERILGTWNEYLGKATNNIAEYKSLLLALRKAHELGIRSLVVHTDSELLHRQLTGRYKVRSKHLIPLFLEARRLLERFESFRIEHVPRAQNREADRLARAARRNRP